MYIIPSSKMYFDFTSLLMLVQLLSSEVTFLKALENIINNIMLEVQKKLQIVIKMCVIKPMIAFLTIWNKHNLDKVSTILENNVDVSMHNRSQ